MQNITARLIPGCLLHSKFVWFTVYVLICLPSYQPFRNAIRRPEISLIFVQFLKEKYNIEIYNVFISKKFL